MTREEMYLNEKHLQQNNLSNFHISVKIYKNGNYVGDCGDYFEAVDENEAMMKAICHFSKVYKIEADDIFITDVEQVFEEVVTGFAYH